MFHGNSKKLGVFGEKIAQNYLERKGYKILDNNYLDNNLSGPLRGEIDIIAKPRRNIFNLLRGKEDDIVHFVEVKSLKAKNFRSCAFSPEQKVNFQKLRKIAKAAESWLINQNLPLDIKWQIDVIAVKISPNFEKTEIQHFENVTPSY